MSIWKQSLKIMECHHMTCNKANIVEEEWAEEFLQCVKKKKNPVNQNNNNNKIMKA